MREKRAFSLLPTSWYEQQKCIEFSVFMDFYGSDAPLKEARLCDDRSCFLLLCLCLVFFLRLHQSCTLSIALCMLAMHTGSRLRRWNTPHTEFSSLMEMLHYFNVHYSCECSWNNRFTCAISKELYGVFSLLLLLLLFWHLFV